MKDVCQKNKIQTKNAHQFAVTHDSWREELKSLGSIACFQSGNMQWMLVMETKVSDTPCHLGHLLIGCWPSNGLSWTSFYTSSGSGLCLCFCPLCLSSSSWHNRMTYFTNVLVFEHLISLASSSDKTATAAGFAVVCLTPAKLVVASPVTPSSPSGCFKGMFLFFALFHTVFFSFCLYLVEF